MKSIAISCGFSLLAGIQVAEAQVVPDRTVGTTVSPTNLIDGGTRSVRLCRVLGLPDNWS